MYYYKYNHYFFCHIDHTADFTLVLLLYYGVRIILMCICEREASLIHIK